MAFDRISKPDKIILGVIVILASTIAMSFSDAIVKLMSSSMTVWQIFFIRSLFAVPCLLALLLWQGSNARPKSILWVFARSSLLILTWLAYYASLPLLSFSVAAVAMYTNPMITTLLSALILKEAVSLRQWLGVAIGFAGVAIILKPGTAAFSWAVLLPMTGAVFYSLAMILTRSKCKNENASTLAIGLHVSFILVGLAAVGFLAALNLSPSVIDSYPFLLETWPTMGPNDWALMACLGALSAAFFLGVAKAYQIAPPQIIGTFDYSYLVFAAIWSFVIFSETPDISIILGILLITVAGILVATQPSWEKGILKPE